MLFRDSIYFHLPWQFKESNVLFCKLEKDLTSLDFIREWVISQNLSVAKSTHWWYKDLPEHTRQSFKNIIFSNELMKMFYKKYDDYSMEICAITDMNEIYVSPPTNVQNTSDQVFFTKHIDGPYYYIPFATVYRVIIGLDNNEEIETVFNQIPTSIILQKGDVTAFDFHRECHYIRKTDCINNDFRVVLKLHYCVYPSSLKMFGKLLTRISIQYDKNFRNLFLYTISPNTIFKKIAAYNVILWTKIYYYIEAYIGYSNILYLSFVSLLYYLTNEYYIFVIMTSFIHYIRYFATYYYKVNVAYMPFVRDFVLYKFISDVNVSNEFDDVLEKIVIFLFINGMYITYFIEQNDIYKYCLGKHLGYIEESFQDSIKRYNTYLYGIFVFLTLNYTNSYLISAHLMFNLLTITYCT